MTKSISFFARKTNSKLAVLFILLGTSFFWSPSANAVQTGNVTITCAKDDGTQRTVNTGWDNSNIFFKDKGDIAALFCTGGFSGGYPLFVSTTAPYGPLRFYNGVNPTPAPEPTPSPTVSVSPSPEPQPSPSDSTTASSSPSPSPTPSATQTSTSPVSDSQTVIVPPETSTVTSDTTTASPMPSPIETITPSETSTLVSEPTIPQEPVSVPVTPPAPPAVEPTPTPAPVSVPVSQPEPLPTPVVEPQPLPDPIPEPEPVAIADPAPDPEVIPLPSPEPVDEPEPIADPAPEPAQEPELLPEEPPAPEEEPLPLAEEPIVDDVPLEPPVAAIDATDEEKKIVAQAIIEQAHGEPVTAQAIANAGLTFADLPPATPVEVRQDENGNEVVLTAEVAAALEVLANPAQLVTAVFTDPGQALLAIASIGADMSVEERKESQKTIIASVIAGQAAVGAAGMAAGATYRRKP